MDRRAKSTKEPKCSICGAATVHEFRPFCSRRCGDADLARWLTGAYAIPGGAADADEDGDAAEAEKVADEVAVKE